MHLRHEQRRALTAIEMCRTSALGGHVDFCSSCGYEHPAYNSCRNRHCPKCQALAQEKWIEAQRARMLDAPHFHVVFTLPAVLRPLAAFARERVFALLFAAAWATLAGFAKRRLAGTVGALLVLHTWTRKLEFHPHVHAIVTAGALSVDGDIWRPSERAFLFPVKAMSSKVSAISAGTEPGTRVHPEVVSVMKEVGIDLESRKPTYLSDELAASAHLLVTMGCGEACPVIPRLRRADWALEDPKGKPIERVREIRDEIRARVLGLVVEEGWQRGSGS